MKTPTELMIVALMIVIPVVVAACVDHELNEPESAQACSCDPHLEAYLELTRQSFHLEQPTGDRIVGIVDGDYRERRGGRTKPATQ